MRTISHRFILCIILSLCFVFNTKANDSDIVNCNRGWKIVVLGSSTSFGTGASTYDSSWVGKFTAYVKRKNPQTLLYNFGIPGYTSYQNLCPTGFSPPANRPSPNSSFNITAALALHPDAIIINLPSNDAANDYTLAEQQANFERAMHLADSANVPVWVSTTQPRNNLTTDEASNLMQMRYWIQSRFADKAVDFWSTIANADGSINSYYDYDYVHVNDKGHDLFYTRMKAETILDSLCIRVTQTLVAKAGIDQSVTLPLNSAILNGSSSYSSLGGTITGYQWRLVSGSQNAQIASPAGAVTTVNNLTEGRYSFALTVTDNAFNVKTDTMNVVVSSRILLDFGQDITSSPDANNNYWNNIVSVQGGIVLTNAVTTGNSASTIGLQVINRIDGTFNVSGPGTNSGNSIGSIGDYPATATNDFSFAEPSATNGQWKITGLETTKQYTIKFWGTRTVADDRIIQIKRADQTVWQEYNAAGNGSYNVAAFFTFSGRSEMSFDIRVKSGSAFGYINLIDISRTTPAQTINVPPAARANDITVPLPATSGTLDGSGSSDDDGNITSYQWIQTSGPSIAAIVSPLTAITSINNLAEGIYTFRLTVTDDSSATSSANVTVTVNSRLLFDIGPDFTNGPDAGGKYWNNVADGLPGVKIDHAITTGNTQTSVSLEIINRIDGTFNTGGPGTNTGNTTGEVGDYPASATTDFAFAHPSATNGSWKIGGLDSTKQYTVKFWGTRSVSDERTIQIKQSGDTVWQEYEARNNTDYNNAAMFTFTGKTERSFDIRVKDNSAFGHISLIDIKITNPPVDCTPAITISGDQTVAACYGTAVTFTATVTNAGLVPAYQWLKNGTVINGITGATYSATDLNNNDSISCVLTASTNCGSGITAVSNKIAALILPAIITGSISGPTDVCPLIGNAVNTTYSVVPVANVNSYTWTVPAGATIVAGQGTAAISVSFTSAFGSTGTITALAGTCANNTAASLNLVRNIPAIPGAISGPASACAYLGTSTQATYSVAAVAYASSYLWTVPATVTIVSGQGTASINVIFSSTFTTSPITVKAISNCFTTKESVLSITTNTTATPGAISGPTEACPFIGTTSTATYTIRKVTGAASYIWVLPAGILISSHPGNSGVNDTIISVTFTSSFVSGSVISVQSAGCIPSAASTLSIFKTAPATPGIISGSTEACAYIGTTNVATYSIRKVINATSYSWTVPAGVTINSHPNGSGVNDTSITVTYNSSFVSGSAINVQAVSCLTSSTASLVISKTAPATPGIISGPTDICSYIGSSATATYTIRKVTGAASYTWLLPAGVSINTHPGGNGVNDTIIKVTFTSGFVSGSAISVQAISCLTSAASNLVLLKIAPSAPGVISGPAEACAYIGTSTTATYTIRKVTGATSYIWTVPAGISISSHPGGSGVNDTTIKVTFSSAFVSGTSISVQAASCITGAATSLTILRPLPATPSAINVIVSPCKYLLYSPVGAFSILKVPGVTYTWNVPVGSVIYHASLTGTSDTIGVIFPLTFNGGTVSVTASNGCGTNGTASSVNVFVTVPASISLNLTGPSDACPYIGTAAGATYRINKVYGVPTYTWTVPSTGVTVVHPNGPGVNDTVIVVNFSTSFNSGSISVTANTACGSSPAKNINLVKTLPATPNNITATVLGSCPNRLYSYSIGSLSANAVSATWSVPSGATIVSGQGTAAITVSYSSSSISGNISVSGTNNCGNSSSAKTLSISLPKCSSNRSVNQVAETAKTSEIAATGLNITVMPNPTYYDFKFIVKSNDKQTPVMLHLTDISGRTIETKVDVVMGQMISLGADYKKGVYIAAFTQGENRTIIKLIKL